MSSLPRRASAPRNPAGPSAGLFAHVLGSPRLPHESDETSVRINPSLTLRCDKQPPMVIHGTMVEPPAGEGQQRADRLRLNLAVAGAVAPGQGTEVIVHNLSVSGVLIETAADLTMGQDIAIALPEAGDVVASVVWQSERLYGCRFRQPLPRAALSAARLRNPLPSDFDPADRADGDTDADAEETLGARLRRLRQARGLSLAGLAQAAGLSKPSIWAWENGTTAPRRTSPSAGEQLQGLQAAGCGIHRLGVVGAGDGRDHHLVDTVHTGLALLEGISLADCEEQHEWHEPGRQAAKTAWAVHRRSCGHG